MGKRIICVMSVLVIGAAIPASADLIGWWTMEQGSGNQVWDYAAPYEDATIVPVNDAAVTWTTDGYKGGALEFLVATAPFTMVDAPLLGGELNIREASYSFWMNMPKAFQAWGPIVVLLGGAMDHDIECDGAADLYVNAQGGNVWFGTKNAKLNDEQWHHVTVTYSTSGNKVVIYVDGKSAATAATALTDAISTVRIGGPRNRSQWRRYIGKLDEVAVWNNTLSADDVKNVFGVGPEWASYASSPTPADGAIVNTANVTLTWTAGKTAAKHHVYISESRADVNDGAPAADKDTTTATTFSNFPWQLGKTYYWRIDEIEADGKTVHVGAIWSFSISAKLASLPDPANGAILVDPNVTLSWTPGSGAVSHSVYFGTSANNLPRVVQSQTPTTYTPATLAFDTVYYWRVDEFDGTSTYTGDVWSFNTTPNIPVTDPNLVGFWNFDRDKNGIAIDWSGHGNHGQIFGDPNSVAGYYLGALMFDGVNDVVEVPQVISRDVAADFTLMAWIKADVPGAAGTTARQGSGLLWSDQSGGGDHFTVAVLGTKLAFETGPGGNPNTISNQDVVTGDWVHVAVTRTDSTRRCQIFINGALDNASVHAGDTRVGSNPKIEIGANVLDSRYFTGMIDEVRAYNRVLTADEIVTATRSNLLLAWKPSPGFGAVVDLLFSSPLTWSAGDGAVKHDVYFGTDKAAVTAATPATAGLYKGRLDQTSWPLAGAVAWGTSYYWRVDEIAADGTVTKGAVWTFRVADYLIIDNFESYTDDDGSRIYQTWIDGYGTTTNGSQVGYLTSPFAERTIIHGGSQSMPLNYNNMGTATVSEAERTWTSPEDWTVHNLNSLVLYVQGRTQNIASPLYVTIKDSTGKSATIVNSNAAVVTTASWQQWSVPFSSLTPVDMSRVKSMVIGVGSRTSPVVAAGLIYIDDIEIHTAP